MILPWQVKETTVYLTAEESYAEISVDKQRWSYSIRPHQATFGLHPEHEHGVEILIKVSGVETTEDARKLCELIAEAVGE